MGVSPVARLLVEPGREVEASCNVPLTRVVCAAGGAHSERSVAVAETVDAIEEDKPEQSVSDLLEKLGHDTGGLIVCEVQVKTVQRAPELQRAIHTLLLALIAGVAAIAAFVLLNWAAVEALSTSLSGWRAPAVLAGAWILVGLTVVVALVVRRGRGSGKPWWLTMRSDPAAALKDREEARGQAEEAIRETLKDLAVAVTRETEARIAAAILPLAGGVAEVGEDLLEASEDIVEAIEEEMPGGSVIAQAIDVALIPARFGMRIVSRAAGRGSGSHEE